ncbi:hypothetical protein R3P38DRAFT_3101415, partial [Favolaschia claudopus]
FLSRSTDDHDITPPSESMTLARNGLSRSRHAIKRRVRVPTTTTSAVAPQQAAATSPETQPPTTTETTHHKEKHGLGALVEKIVHPTHHGDHTHSHTDTVSVPVAQPEKPSDGVAGAHLAPGGSAVGGIL